MMEPDGRFRKDEIMDSRKMVFFDVDDTLIHHRGDKSYIPDSAKAAIRSLKEEGHLVAIASGRGHEHIRQIMKMLGIDHAVCFNGHMAVVDNAVVMTDPLHREETHRLLRKLKRGIYPFIVTKEDTAYLKDFLGKVKATIKRELKVVEGAEEDVYLGKLKKFKRPEGDYNGMMFFRKTFKDQEAYPHLDFKSWGDKGFEVGNKGVSKLTGIHWMADYFGMAHKDIVVFGDNYNDLEMLEGIERSVAMGNAVEAAKKVAYHVTDHVGEDGIAKACHYLGLIKEEVH